MWGDTLPPPPVGGNTLLGEGGGFFNIVIYRKIASKYAKLTVELHVCE